jgi:hypothetical protein
MRKHLRFASAQNFWDANVRLGVIWIAMAHLLRHHFFLLIAVRNSNPLHRFVKSDIDNATVGEERHSQSRHVAQRRLVVERRS